MSASATMRRIFDFKLRRSDRSVERYPVHLPNEGSNQHHGGSNDNSHQLQAARQGV